MSARTGIAVGVLRNPLMGTIPGVKLFRRSCLEGRPLHDTLAPGRKYAHGEDGRGLHPAAPHSSSDGAPVARTARAQGFLGRETRDIAKPRPDAGDAAFLRRLALSPRDTHVATRPIRRLMAHAAEPLFEAFSELGAFLHTGSPAAVLGCMRVLGENDEPRYHLAEVALGAGVMASPAPAAIPAAFERLAPTWATRKSLERAA